MTGRDVGGRVPLHIYYRGGGIAHFTLQHFTTAILYLVLKLLL